MIQIQTEKAQRSVTLTINITIVSRHVVFAERQDWSIIKKYDNTLRQSHTMHRLHDIQIAKLSAQKQNIYITKEQNSASNISTKLLHHSWKIAF